MPDQEFGADSKVVEVVQRLGDRGRDALRRHGYETGEGFVDVLSQYQTLEHAARQDRIRDLGGLLKELNSAG
ncbi:MAG TPA: hypothetical protein VFR33_10185 [Candidatus Dormibacteraeota bacterium]|nr:hypothetical protein [Candidatus Dormibacteraeota bacterium]